MLEVVEMYRLCKDPRSARERILQRVVGVYKHPKRQYRELMERFEQVMLQPVPLSKKDPDIVCTPLIYLELVSGLPPKASVDGVNV